MTALVAQPQFETEAAWLAERKRGIGGSDAAAILGLSKFRTPLQVYLDKIGQAPPIEETAPMRWGKKLEPLILDEYEQIKGGYRNHINGIQGGMRSYFNNAHDAMRDVWEFSRVIGDERHGHATPKPVDMMERVMLSSLPEGGLCAEPFGGSGSTLIGAETTGRVCYTMELQAKSCDVIVRRWQQFTGKRATLEATGAEFPA